MPLSDPRLPAPWFYCATLPHPRLGQAHNVVLDADQTRHARKVLRCKPGNRVELFDGQGMRARAVIAEYQADATLCRVEEVEIAERPRPYMTLAAAIAKGSRGDDMIDPLSQLGCDRLIPLLTERSIVDPRPTKIERYAAAAIESAKQCRRAFVMQIDPPADLAQVLKLDCDVALIGVPSAGRASADLPRRLRKAEHVMLLIGPEGDFTDDERDAAAAAGCLPWRMAEHILRVGTAAAAAVGIVRYMAQWMEA